MQLSPEVPTVFEGAQADAKHRLCPLVVYRNHVVPGVSDGSYLFSFDDGALPTHTLDRQLLGVYVETEVTHASQPTAMMPNSRHAQKGQSCAQSQPGQAVLSTH